MYVNNICYALNCYLNGNGLTAKIGPDDWVKLVATGYDAEGNKTRDASIYLCNGPDNIITDWTKFDLSGLGKVAKVEFNITGSSDNGYGFSQPAYFAYDDVAVRFEKTVIPAESVTLDKNTLTLKPGETGTLTAAVTPENTSDKPVVWASSDETVATVENGTVTALKPGTATITAACGSVTASTTVTVLAIPTEATTGGTVSSGTTSANSGQVITVTPSYVVLKPGATRTLSAKATPASASQSFTYKSGNSSVATVNPTVQTIQDSTDHEVVFAQSEVPVITGDILNSLRTTGKTLCVVGDGYTLQVSGKDVRNTTGELNTSLELQQVEQGLEFVVNDGKTVPCSARIDLDKSDYSRLYLYNETTGKWQYLNSYKDGVITLDTAGRYLLTNENLRFANINWTFFIAGGAVLVVIAVAYIAFKKRYWFW